MKETLSDLAEKAKIPPRIVVRKHHANWLAYIQGHEPETRRVAETRDAAIGMVVRDFPELLHIEIDSDEPN